MRQRASVCDAGGRLFAGRAYLQRPSSSQPSESSADDSKNEKPEACKKQAVCPEQQEQEAETAPLSATPDSNATTLVLPGLRSEPEDEVSSEVSTESLGELRNLSSLDSRSPCEEKAVQGPGA